MSDHLNDNKPNLLPEEMLDPNQRKMQQQQMQQDMMSKVSEYRQSGVKTEAPSPSETVYVMNNKPNSVHLVDAGIIINGQLTVDPKGPFTTLTESTIQENLLLQDLMQEQEMEDGSRRSTLKRLTREEYQDEYNKFKIRRSKRVNSLASGSDYEREDSEYDVQAVRRKVVRVQG